MYKVNNVVSTSTGGFKSVGVMQDKVIKYALIISCMGAPYHIGNSTYCINSGEEFLISVKLKD